MHLKVVSYGKDASFIYADPPYIGATQKHYAGYTEENYEDLLKALEATDAKFMLSSYPSSLLSKYSEKNKWISKEIEMVHNSSKVDEEGSQKTKVEVLTMNYSLNRNQLSFG